MPSGWKIHYVVLLSAVFALCIPLTLRLMSNLFGSTANKTPRTDPPHSTMPLGRRINTRYFLGAHLAFLLVAFALLLIPCVIAANLKNRAASISLLSLSCYAILGLIYAVKKGDFDWLKTWKESGD